MKQKQELRKIIMNDRKINYNVFSKIKLINTIQRLLINRQKTLDTIIKLRLEIDFIKRGSKDKLVKDLLNKLEIMRIENNRLNRYCKDLEHGKLNNMLINSGG